VTGSDVTTLRLSSYPFPPELRGYWLFVAARGRGIATRAAGALVDHAFANGIFRVEARVRVANTPSERVLERLGFRLGRVERSYLRHAGARVDATLVARLSDDRRVAR
jgi:RimJ/RimL family protein N-acetyltransferase